MTYVKGKISELFDKLPAGVQDFIYDPATDKKIADIGAKYSLNAQQIENLTDETQYVIIGYKRAEDVAESIQKNVGVSYETSRSLASDINGQILRLARELVETPSMAINTEETPEFIDVIDAEVEEKYKTLPEDVRKAITSVEVSAKITGLAEKYRLHIDKADELSDETGLVMLGLTHPRDYLNNLKKRLEIPEDLAREIVADINNQIFLPIRQSLKKIHNMAEERDYSTARETNFDAENRMRLSKEDEKILAESGIEVEKDLRPTTDDLRPITDNNESGQGNTPKKEDLIKAVENPNDIKQNGGATIPAGFAMNNKQLTTDNKQGDRQNSVEQNQGGQATNNEQMTIDNKQETMSGGEKMGGPSKRPEPRKEATEEENTPTKQPPAVEPKKVDPYREPVG
ncbi:MAG: hypothetical protein AAB428_00610 [Patescibacteria group bacterium]